MRNTENIGHIVRGKHAITSLVLTCKIFTVCYFIIYEGMQQTHFNPFIN